jgi:hypothetical protein
MTSKRFETEDGNTRVDVIRVTRDSGSREYFRVTSHSTFMGEFTGVRALAEVVDLGTLREAL